MRVVIAMARMVAMIILMDVITLMTMTTATANALMEIVGILIQRNNVTENNADTRMMQTKHKNVAHLTNRWMTTTIHKIKKPFRL